MNNSMEILKDNLSFYEQCLCPTATDKINLSSKKELLKEIINKQIQIEEDIFELRLKKIIETQEPYLPPLDFELDKKSFYIAAPNLQLSIEHLLKLKIKIMDFILNLSNVSVSRIGYHWNEGHISLEQLISRYIENDIKFIKEIKNII
ncbi:MAG: hypothetical protein KAR38_13305 [Calditrichia bacterium]|nr:hypothetical protein [Calditrichia bacterium]